MLKRKWNGLIGKRPCVSIVVVLSPIFQSFPTALRAVRYLSMLKLWQRHPLTKIRFIFWHSAPETPSLSLSLYTCVYKPNLKIRLISNCIVKRKTKNPLFYFILFKSKIQHKPLFELKCRSSSSSRSSETSGCWKFMQFTKVLYSRTIYVRI